MRERRQTTQSSQCSVPRGPSLPRGFLEAGNVESILAHLANPGEKGAIPGDRAVLAAAWFPEEGTWGRSLGTLRTGGTPSTSDRAGPYFREIPHLRGTSGTRWRTDDGHAACPTVIVGGI